MSDATQYKAFKARLVMGSPFTLNTTDHENNPQKDENKHNWFMAFAVPKGPEWDAIYSTMYAAASADPACTAALCSQPGFNFKIEDCDAPEDPQKLGTESRPAGHMLIKFTRYKKMGPHSVIDGNHQPILNETAIKKGDYFWIAGSTKFNGAATVKTNAGMYQNIDMLMFAEAGEEIIGESGASAETLFDGIQGGQVVNGATSQAGAPVAAKPAPPASAPPAPPPAHDLANPAPPPADIVMLTYNGTSKTNADWLLAGWNQQQIDANCK